MRLKLPHLDPVRFAQDLISSTEKTCLVSAKFPTVPSLAMISEAAAQSSAAFFFDTKDKELMAFLVMLKNITLEQKPLGLELEIRLQIEQDLGDMMYLSFTAMETEVHIAHGDFAIAVPK
ncbi:hypothetical protein ACFLR3_03565 [Campylobacterota bacterium]